MSKHKVIEQYMIQCRMVGIVDSDAESLRRAALTLHRWAELECGDGNDWASWAIERDETTGVPYMHRYPHSGKSSRSRIADHEKGAQRRVESIAKRIGASVEYQGDPRGWPLMLTLPDGRTLSPPPYSR